MIPRGPAWAGEWLRPRERSVWLVVSGLVHLGLLAVLVVVSAGSGRERRGADPSILRVRLLGDVLVSAPAREEPKPPSPPRRLPPRPAPPAASAPGILPEAPAGRLPAPQPFSEQPVKTVTESPGPSATGGTAGPALAGDPAPRGPGGIAGEPRIASSREYRQGPHPSAMVGDGQLASDLDSAPKSEPKRTGIFLAHAVPGGVGRTGAGTGDLGPGGGSAVTGRADGGGSGIGAPGGQGSGVGGLGDGSGHIARAGVPGPDGGLADLLRVIRRRIEEAKVYPDSARRAGLQGTAELQFRIGPDGAPQGLEIVRSSGHVELDEVSRQTILRAGPYPVVRGRIRIPLSYRLDR